MCTHRRDNAVHIEGDVVEDHTVPGFLDAPEDEKKRSIGGGFIQTCSRGERGVDGGQVGWNEGVGEDPVPETAEAGARHKEVHSIFNPGAERADVSVEATMVVQAFLRSGPPKAQ